MLTDLTENGRQKCAAYFPVQLDDRLVVIDTAASMVATTSDGGDGTTSFFKDDVTEKNGDEGRRRPSTQPPSHFEGNCFVVQNQVSGRGEGGGGLENQLFIFIFLGNYRKKWLHNTKVACSSVFHRRNGHHGVCRLSLLVSGLAGPSIAARY